MSHSHPSAPGHSHAAPPHSHTHVRRPPGLSPLGAGLGLRLAISAAAAGLLWLSILWALD